LKDKVMAPMRNPSDPVTRFDSAGYALAIGGATLFSTKGVFIKLAFAEGLSPDQVLALRMIVAVPVYLAIGAWLLWREPRRRELLSPRLAGAAAAVGTLAYFGAAYLDFAGLGFVSAQYERLVLFTYPFFTLALGVLVFGDAMNWRLIPAMALSYAGILVLFGWNLITRPDGIAIGTALVLASGLVFALYQHLARRVMAPLGSRLFTCIGMGAAGLVGIAFATLRTGPATWFGLSPAAWSYGLALGLVGTVAPSFLLNAAIARIGPRGVSAMGNFGPVTTIILAIIVLGEPFTAFHALGTVCVLAGAVWFSRADHKTRAGIVG
jgi:drug/metabolite transporter (DMT)-like permease